ncbi:hypothetical protein KQX54_021049 [Cotesia glomerata]|uniref:Uncharacterized protein n=1 Tax=Cotesia glomerata TaxID=32391 RepID=A0AAV7J842_COTGL|nr:hypothetical protein KQX54_021049 [Cotesia glomerata]
MSELKRIIYIDEEVFLFEIAKVHECIRWWVRFRVTSESDWMEGRIPLALSEGASATTVTAACVEHQQHEAAPW